MPLIAITGGIGAGKSEFTRLLGKLAGAECIDTDRLARELLETDPPTIAAVRAAFGASIIDSQGHIDRAGLRKAVFMSEDGRRSLEAILHPRIRAAWTDWAAKRNVSGSILLVEIPLLYETEAAGLFDYSIAVGCTRATQTRRLTEGRQLSPAMAGQMMASQWKIEAKITRCDFLIWNDGSRQALENQTALCLARLRGTPNFSLSRSSS